MRLKIRAKLIGILFVAAVLPLGIAIIAIYGLGYHDYKRERGRLFQTVASHLAVSLDQSLDRQVGQLNDWVALVRLATLLPPSSAPARPAAEPGHGPGSVRPDSEWAGLGAGAPAVQAVLTNDLAQALRQFQAINPLLAEIQVTDAQGELVAATRKPARRFYGDQRWWQQTVRVRPALVYLEGIAFDPSAGVYALDVCLPIRSGGRASGAPAGVVRAVLNASRMFAMTPRVQVDSGLSQQIILADGEILFDLFRDQPAPVSKRIAAAAARVVTAGAPGWTVARIDDRQARLIGFTPLSLGRPALDDTVLPGLVPLFVLVHDDAATVLAPVRKQLWLIAGAGVLILLSFTLAGLYIANRKIVGPIQLLRSAAQTIAASAKLNEAALSECSLATSPQARRVLTEIGRIHSGDELDDLAHDFASMARRVLSYHERLEEQIATKTAEIQSDLQVAREFQESLMPRSYPEIPPAGSADPIGLRFHHLYQPAGSVGGDFFDVRQLSEHRAGILIADVMGHGARAALATAILRTLLQDLAGEANDPARLLGLINRHFADIARTSSQGLFVSAFYLIIDTEQAVATYASAGHPSPLLADHAAGQVAPLLDHQANSPALGLFPESAYNNLTRPVKPGEVFLLFTDGVFEANGPGDEDFGCHRLRAVVEQNLAGDLPHLTSAILTAVTKFRESVALRDDICVVAVEVTHRQ